jgi:hypothetical protein
MGVSVVDLSMGLSKFADRWGQLLTDWGCEDILDFRDVLAQQLPGAGCRVDFGSQLAGGWEVLGLLKVVIDTLEEQFDHIPVWCSVLAQRVDSVLFQGAYVRFNLDRVVAYGGWLEAQLWRYVASRHTFLVLGDT